MDKKNQQSKAQFGTLTAKHDANNDYSQSPNASSSTAMETSSTTAGTSPANSASITEYGTMTAKFDANNDYDKSGSQNKSGANAQSGGKTKTSDKNVGR